MKKIKLIILDDHKILRAGLKMLLGSEQNISIIYETDNRKDLFNILQSNPCDILLLDITLNKENGFEIMDEVRDKYPDIKIIILTMHENPQYIKQALKKGARGYVSKRSADRDLINAINTVMSGGIFLDTEVAKKITDEEKSGIQLSEREIQVLSLYVKGFTLKEIANQLGISEKTVDTYKNRIYEKTKLSTRPSLLEFAIKKGYIKIDSQ